VNRVREPRSQRKITDMVSPPLVSVLLPTRDRPRFLPLALEYYRSQSYLRRELIVVDDGQQFPVDAGAVDSVGGRVVHVAPGTPIGSKLNVGAAEARGTLCMKMDDDDWYAPELLTKMVSDLVGSWEMICKPTISIVMRYLYFDLMRWEIRVSKENDVAGAALLFSRDSWEEHPFDPVSHGEDTRFIGEQSRQGLEVRAIRTPREFIAVRHRGMTGDRNHTWWPEWWQRGAEASSEERPLYSLGPEELMQAWAIDMYRELQGNASVSIQ
jgi:glycosyltransferase involved in cell wall biosynthesis